MDIGADPDVKWPSALRIHLKMKGVPVMTQPGPVGAQRVAVRRVTLAGGAAIVFYSRKDGPTREDVMKQVRDIAADALRRKSGGV